MKLLDYIRGNRKGKEAHRLEQESMKDSFLSDALDGYQEVDGNHEEKINRLRMQVSKRSVKSRAMYAVVWSIASCLVIGIGISLYFLFMKQHTTEELFLTKEQSQLTIFAPTLPQEKSSVAKDKDGKADSAQDMASRQAGKRDILAKSKPVASSQTDIILTVSAVKEDAAFEVMQEEAKQVADTESNAESKAQKAIQLSNEIKINGAERKATVAQAEPMMIRGTGSTKFNQADFKAFIEKLPKKEVDKMTPKPTIGMRKYKKYLNKNLIRPTDETCKDVQGEVSVIFFVNADGQPHSFTVTSGLCESADKEAIRLIKEGPKWTSGLLPVEITVKF